ncbi:hypothetical protein SUDANB95_04983 [Actinosynnema sp. ALI-1.44]
MSAGRRATGATPDATPPDIAAGLALYDRLVEAGRQDADHAGAQRLIATSPPVFRDLFERLWGEVDERLWGFTKRKQDHDPVPDLLALRCPLLALFGGSDELVPIADSVHVFAAAACHPGRDPRATLTVEVLPHANHRLLVDGHPAPGYLDRLSRWITTAR